MITFTIPGDPKGKARPRVTKKGFTYTPKKTVNYETFVKECFVISYNNFKPLESDLKVDLIVCYPLLKSMSKIKREKALNGEIRPSKKPDCDNIAKIVLDALNNIAYLDDKQVVDLSIKKWYSETPRVDVVIRELI